MSRPGGMNGFNPKLLPVVVSFKDKRDERDVKQELAYRGYRQCLDQSENISFANYLLYLETGQYLHSCEQDKKVFNRMLDFGAGVGVAALGRASNKLSDKLLVVCLRFKLPSL